MASDPATTPWARTSELRAHVRAESIRLPRHFLERFTPRIWGQVARPYLFLAAAIALDRLTALHWAVLLPAQFVLLLAAHRSFVTLVHDASHLLFSPQPKRNDLLGQFLAAGWIGLSVQAYRAIHYQHHLHNGSADDPEFLDYENIREQGGLKRFVLRYVFCLHALRLVRKYYRPSQAGPESHSSKAGRFWKVIAANRHILVTQLALCAGLILSGTLYLYPLWLYLTVSWSPMLSGLRFVVEHPGKSDRTVSTLSSFLELPFFAPYHFNYHMEHHLWPSVPPYRLREVHRFLRGQGFYTRHPECLNSTYIGSLRQRARLL